MTSSVDFATIGGAAVNALAVGEGANIMKKLLAVLLCGLVLSLPLPAPAEAPDAIPEDRIEDFTPRDGAPGAETFTLEVDGESVQLAFDSSPQYSSIQDGLVQASYYAYGSDGINLFELYIIFPDTAKAGMVITPEYIAMTNEESSIVLIQSDNNSEKYFFSSLMDGKVYPAGSDFTISIGAVDETAEGITYSGTLSATLIALDTASGEVIATLAIPETPFRFTIAPGVQERHPDPMPTIAPSDDLRRV